MPPNEIVSPIQDRIVMTSFAAFNSQGYKAVTMEVVAKELRISKKTIYRYFSSKEEILIAGMEANFLRLEEKLKKNSSREGEEIFLRLGAIYRGYLRIFSPALQADISEQLPHLQERISLFERNAFEKSFIKHAKFLRTGKIIEYPFPSRELALSFFAMVRGLAEVSKGKADFITSCFYKGISLKAKKGKK